MQTKLATWASQLLTVVGAVLVAAFFLAWISDGTSGLSIAWHHEHWLFLVPLSGLALAATANGRSVHTRLAAVAAGALVAGDLMLEMLRGMLHGGLETWLIFGGAAIVLFAGMAESRRGLRTIGGIAVLAGFFAPWTGDSMFKGLLENSGLADAFGLSIKVLWLIPLGGAAAIVSGTMTGPRGKWLAAGSGIAVFGSMLWMMGSLANLVFAWGAWATLAGSACALAIGVLAPSEKSAA